LWKKSVTVSHYHQHLSFAAMLTVAASSGSPNRFNKMSFFQCSECNCVEDTALCHYWSARLRETPTLCSACDPRIAKWHGQFPREPAKDWITDRRGLLYKKNEVERWLGQPIRSIT
jgi:hypothetical protein